MVSSYQQAAARSWQNESKLQVAGGFSYVYALLIAFIVPYVLFQNHLLPSSLNKLASKFYFWPTLPLTMLRKWLNGGSYWDEMDKNVIIGAAPLPWHIPQLKELGVTAVINMQYEYDGPVEAYKTAGIKHIRLPTEDHVEPSTVCLKTAIEFIEQQVKENAEAKVYVHCKAGHGRSAAAVLVWLAYKHPEKSLQTLNEFMLSIRHVRSKLYLQPNVIAMKKWIDLQE